MESLIMVECTEPIFEDDRDDFICEIRNNDCGHGVECILPSIEYKKEDEDMPYDEFSALLIPGYQDTENTFEAEVNPHQEVEDTDDPWSAAKRGDLRALMKYGENGHNWKLEDAHECTPLYYACHSGAASPQGIPALRYLLDQWTEQIPSHVFERCRTNAINHNVVRLLDATQGSLCGIVVDTSQAAAVEHAGCTQPDIFDGEGWGGDLLFGENIIDDRCHQSEFTMSDASGPAFNSIDQVGCFAVETGSLTYSDSSSGSDASVTYGCGGCHDF